MMGRPPASSPAPFNERPCSILYTKKGDLCQGICKRLGVFTYIAYMAICFNKVLSIYL